MLLSVYGDTIHLNDGSHLHGGIEAATDLKWQRWWLQVVSVDLKLWIPPLGCADGKRFVNMLANEFRGVRLRQWNAEKAILFPPLILHRLGYVKSASEIKRKIISRMDLWEAGRYTELVQEVIISGKSGVAGRKPEEWEGEEVSESVARTYNNMVIDGRILRDAVRFATGRGQGMIFAPKLDSVFWKYCVRNTLRYGCQCRQRMVICPVSSNMRKVFQ